MNVKHIHQVVRGTHFQNEFSICKFLLEFVNPVCLCIAVNLVTVEFIGYNYIVAIQNLYCYACFMLQNSNKKLNFF